jgi:hypothetical protein
VNTAAAPFIAEQGEGGGAQRQASAGAGASMIQAAPASKLVFKPPRFARIRSPSSFADHGIAHPTQALGNFSAKNVFVLR